MPKPSRDNKKIADVSLPVNSSLECAPDPADLADALADIVRLPEEQQALSIRNFFSRLGFNSGGSE